MQQLAGHHHPHPGVHLNTKNRPPPYPLGSLAPARMLSGARSELTERRVRLQLASWTSRRVCREGCKQSAFRPRRGICKSGHG